MAAAAEGGSVTNVKSGASGAASLNLVGKKFPQRGGNLETEHSHHGKHSQLLTETYTRPEICETQYKETVSVPKAHFLVKVMTKKEEIQMMIRSDQIRYIQMMIRLNTALVLSGHIEQK